MPLRLESAFLSLLALGAGAIGSALLATGDEATPTYQPRVNPTFINFETPHCHPLELTPDGQRLLAVNTADNSLEVFRIVSGSLVAEGTVAVGLDPVSVRCRDTDEVWVVNNISDSVSIVSLGSMSVVRTLKTGDEPFDVVFAGSPTRAFVSCSMIDAVQVFDPGNPGAAPVTVAIDAQRPRSLAVSPDGAAVYAAIYESGNGTTVLGGGGGTTGNTLAFPPNAVSEPAGPYGGTNPPPNSGGGFSPVINGANPGAPKVGLIVRKDAAGQWMDDNNHNWTGLVSGAQAPLSGRPVGWDLPDRDLAVISTSSLNVSYATTLMNIGMSVGVNPATGVVTMVGTDAINHVRFEPNVNGRFVRVNMASVSPVNLANKTVVDLNPHLNYATATLAQQGQRDRAIGDPRAIVWNSAGTRAYIAGMGSNNVIVVNPAGARAGGDPSTQTIEVGEGPTGLALDEARGRLYVLNRFAGSISVVNLADDSEAFRVPFFDPTPGAIRVGRKHLYDTHKNSGLGQAACASCHIDGKMDRLAWDLGDPAGAVVPLNDLNQGFGVPGLAPNLGSPAYSAWHPMKGPMTTQTLQHIIGLEPLHWRADRSGLEAFNGAFMGLQGDDQMLTAQEMQEFENFLATIYFPPNPFRNFDNTLPTSLPLPGHYATGRFSMAAGTPLPNGNAQNGRDLYRSTARPLDNGALACATCHTLPTGAGPDHRRNLQTSQWDPISPGAMGQRHIGVVSVDGSTQTTIKVPQLRNVYKKAGFNATRTSNNAGFGYLHDGSVDSIERFVNEPVFNLASDQETADMVAFLLSFAGSEFAAPGNLEPPGPTSNDVPAAVGVQTTLRSGASPEPGQLTLISSMIARANTGQVGLVAKARINSQGRGFRYNGGGVWQSDHAGETWTSAQLQAAAGSGSEVTYTIVPKNSETRIGIDRDLDGVLNFDEAPLPPLCGTADFNGDGDVGTDQDIEAYFACLGGNCCPLCGTADFNFDGDVGTDQDIEAFFRVLGGGGC